MKIANKTSTKAKEIKKELKFNTITKQREFMDNLASKLKLKTTRDWEKVNTKNICKNGGRSLLQHYYKNDFEELLLKIYPENDWKFEENFRNSKIFFSKIVNQRKYLDFLFTKIGLKNLNDWLKISPKNYLKKFGGSKLIDVYNNDFNQLFQTIYPNFPWEFEERLISRKNLKKLEYQEEYLQFLFKKFKLKTLDEWNEISLSQIKQNGGKKLLELYENSKRSLLSTLYPNFPWIFYSPFEKKYHTHENRQLFFDRLFYQFKMITLDDWSEITKKMIFDNGGKFMLTNYYNNNIKKMLTEIYPNFPWNFHSFRVIKNRQKIADQLFYKFNFKSLDDWLKLSKKIKNNLKKYLPRSFLKNKKKILPIIYPNFPWNFEAKNQFNFTTIIHQYEKMEKLFFELKLNGLDDWLKIKFSKLKKKIGKILVRYSFDFPLLLSTLYPNFTWNFQTSFSDFRSLQNQRILFDQLYKNFHLKSLDDWVKMSPKIIAKNIGKSTMKYLYSNDLKKLLPKIYPNFPWNFQTIDHYKIIHVQRSLMEKLFTFLKFKSLDDWLNIRKYHVVKDGWRRLFDFYSNDVKKMLLTIYPNFPWDFEHENFKHNCKFIQSTKFNLEKIIYLKKKYLIREKKDWYRLNIKIDEINVFKALKLIFPDEKWHKELFLLRTKKSNQRLLFVYIQQLYSSLVILENYFHPILLHKNHCLEYDIYIPSLNLAMEYQGEQHYDDIPAAFGQFELHHERDQLKELLSNKNNVNFITIPYWWDHSISSLLSTIHLPTYYPLKYD